MQNNTHGFMPHQCLTKHNVAIKAKIALCILQFCGLRNNPHRYNYRMQDQIDVTVVHTEVVPSQFEITNGDNFSCNIVALMDTLKKFFMKFFYTITKNVRLTPRIS